MDTNGKPRGFATRGDLLEAGKAIHDKLHDGLDKRTKQLQQETLLQTGQVLAKSLGEVKGDLDKLTKDLEGEKADRHQNVAALRKEMSDRLEALEKMFAEGFSKMVEAIKSLPTPTVGVTIPENAILVQQVPSHVDVHLPEMSPNISLPEMAPVVNVPELHPTFHMPQLSPVFQVPEQQSVINVNVPKPRRVTKSFQYDQNGRPLSVTESEIKEE